MVSSSATPAAVTSPYKIVCDAGSTGTRLYVYHRDGSGVKDVGIQEGPKVKPGLSAQTTSTVKDYLLPNLLVAKKMIPPEFHASTPVFVYATAGMRLLREDEQANIYDSLTAGMASHPDVPFVIQRENLKTIGGDEEGYFAALAVNYLAGRLGSDLLVQPPAEEKKEMEGRLYGALDLGGASAQIVMHKPANIEPRKMLRGGNESPSKPVGRDDFFSLSLLGLGGSQMKASLESYVSKKHNGHIKGKVVENPCNFRGYKTEIGGLEHVGVGNAGQCMKALDNIVQKVAGDDLLGPSPPKLEGEFYAMTLFYFALESAQFVLNELAEHGGAVGDKLKVREALSASNPTVDAIVDATHVVCEANYDFVFAELGQIDDQIQDRCLELALVATLLRRLGFPASDNKIHFVKQINDSTAEWTLGTFLHLTNSHQMGGEASKAVSFGEAPTSMFQFDTAENQGYTALVWFSLLAFVGCILFTTRKFGRGKSDRGV